MELRVLGMLELWAGDRVVIPRRRLARVLLGVLALRADRTLPVDAAVEMLWAGKQPRSAGANLRSYVAQLRRLLPAAAPDDPAVESVPGGYRLTAGPSGLDRIAFEVAVERGRRSLAEGAHQVAARQLTGALGRWRGPVLAGLDLPELVAEDVRRLEDLRLAVVEDNIDARLGAGAHAELADELPGLVAADPYRERLWAQLMLALYRCGRQAEALATYRRLFRLLDEELGVRPGEPVRRLHARILRGDDDLRPRESVTLRRTRPWQPPSPPAPFVGRADELAALSEPDTPVVLLTGTAGVGKTGLALYWAHRAAHAYPDGCLYTDLRGFGPDQPRTPDEVMAGFLHALGVPEPPGVALAGRYRSELAGRRMLVLLDNARDAAQVRPLLPGSSCRTVVTSRDTLAGLVARDGARRLPIPVLPERDAAGLLIRLIGDRATADPALTATLARRCARLPLALRLAAESIAAQRGATLTDLAGQLADEQTRLDLLDAGGDPQTALRAVLSWSNRALSPPAARAFRLLSVYPGRWFDEDAVAALTGSSARAAVAELLRASLVEEVGRGRYSSHDLLRSHAREWAGQVESPEARHAALGRLLHRRGYLAARATDLVYPHEAHRRPAVPDPTSPAVTVPFNRAGDARGWLDAELDNLLALAAAAAAGGHPGQVRTLSATLHRHLRTRGRYLDMLALHDLALRTAQEQGDRAGQAEARHDRGIALVRLSRYDEALADLTEALDAYRELADPAGAGAVRYGLGMLHQQQGRPEAALAEYERALVLHRVAGDRAAEGATLGAVGLVHEWRGEWLSALDCYRQALAVHRSTGFRNAEGDILNDIAIVYRQLGRYPEAVEQLTQALAVYRETGDRGGEGAALNNLGLALLSLDRWDDARGYLTAALAVHRDVGSQVGELETRNILALLAHRAGNQADAVARFRDTLAASRRLGIVGSEMNARHGLAQALYAAGQPARALPHAEAELDLARTTGSRVGEADALTAVAHCLAALGHLGSAARRWSEATAIYAELGITDRRAPGRPRTAATAPPDGPDPVPADGGGPAVVSERSGRQGESVGG